MSNESMPSIYQTATKLFNLPQRKQFQVHQRYKSTSPKQYYHERKVIDQEIMYAKNRVAKLLREEQRAKKITHELKMRIENLNIVKNYAFKVIYNQHKQANQIKQRQFQNYNNFRIQSNFEQRRQREISVQQQRELISFRNSQQAQRIKTQMLQTRNTIDSINQTDYEMTENKKKSTSIPAHQISKVQESLLRVKLDCQRKLDEHKEVTNQMIQQIYELEEQESQIIQNLQQVYQMHQVEYEKLNTTAF